MKEFNQNLYKQNNRLYLDIVKGIAIFLMLWGHCIQCCANGTFDYFENDVFKLIYSFHMPLFMLVSGYLFAFSCKKRTLGKLLIHRTQGLLQPLVMWTILYYLLTDVMAKNHFRSILEANWLSKLGTESFWFLWSVLAASIIIGIAYKITNHIVIRISIAIIGFGFVCLFPNLELNVFMYPYYLLGFIFAFIKDKIPTWIINIKYISLITFPVMLFFYKKEHYIYTTGIYNDEYNWMTIVGINLFRWAIGFVGCIFVLVIVKWILILMQKTNIANQIGYAISNLGRKSLQVYCVSIPLLSFFLPKVYSLFCVKIGINLFAQNMLLYNFVYTLILALCYAVVLYYCIKLLEKIKVSKVVFGR